MKPWEQQFVSSADSESAPWAQQFESSEDMKARGTAAAKAAVERSRASPEQVAAREREQKHPVRQYLSDWADQVQGSLPDSAVSEEGLASDIGSGIAGALELPLTLATGVTSLATEPLAELLTGRDQPRGAHVYEPRSRGGRQLAGMAGAALKPVGDYFTEAVPTGLAAGAEALGASPEMAAELGEAGSRGLEAATIVSPVRALRSPKAPVVAPGAEGVQAGRTATAVSETLPKGGAGRLGEARALDFKIPPSEAAIQPERITGPAPGGFREALANPGVKIRMQVENQKIANRHAAVELGLDQKTSLPAQVQKVIDEHGAVAQEAADAAGKFVPNEAFKARVGELGARIRDNPALENVPGVEKLRDRLLNIEKMTGQQMLDSIRKWRKDASTFFKAVGDVEKQDVAATMREAADIMQDALAESVRYDEGLYSRFTTSRQRAAKAHNVQDSLIGDNINLAALARIGEKTKLTGRLQQLARVAEEFPELTKTQSAIRPAAQQQSVVFSPVKRAAQRVAGRKIQERLISDEFQNQFGEVAPGIFDPPGPAAIMERGPTLPADGLPFEPTGSVPPAAALRGGPRDLELAPDTLHRGIAGMLEGEPVPGRPGDLTASAPPAIEGIPFEGSDLAPISELTLAPEQGVGGFRGAKVPEEAALTEFVSDQPIERRRPGAEPYTGVERRKSIGDLLKEPGVRETEYQRHLENKANIGVRAPDESLVSEQQAVREIMERPGMRDEQRRISEENLAILRAQADAETAIPTELPIGGQVAPETGGPIVPETGEFARRSNVPVSGDVNEIGFFRSNADIGDMIGNQRVRPAEGVLDISERELRELGFTDEEILQILAGQ